MFTYVCHRKTAHYVPCDHHVTTLFVFVLIANVYVSLLLRNKILFDLICSQFEIFCLQHIQMADKTSSSKQNLLAIMLRRAEFSAIPIDI